MKIKYYKETKNQPGNAFIKVGKQKPLLQETLTRALTFICQSSQSRNPELRDCWEAMTTPHKIFGRSSRNQCQNTGLSALAGAVEKLSVPNGDLSEKQIENIKPVFAVLNKMFPDQFDPLEFEDMAKPQTTWGNGLFASDSE